MYEWGLYLLRYKKNSERRIRDWEDNWERTRIMWATLVNINVGKGKKVKPSDLIELSYDKKKVEEIKPGERVSKFKPKL